MSSGCLPDNGPRLLSRSFATIYSRISLTVWGNEKSGRNSSGYLQYSVQHIAMIASGIQSPFFLSSLSITNMSELGSDADLAVAFLNVLMGLRLPPTV